MNTMSLIILAAICSLETYIFYDFFDNYFEKNEKYSAAMTRLAVSVGMTTLLFMVNMQGNTYLNLFSSPILLWIYLNILFKAELGSKIICLSVALCLSFGCEVLFVLLLSDSVRTSQMDFMEPWALFIIKLLNYVLLSLVKQISNKSKKRISGKVFAIYISIPLSSIGIMVITYYSGMDLVHRNIWLTICFFLMAVGNIALFYAFMKYSEGMYRNMENEITIAKYKADLSHYRQLQQVSERHDMLLHNVGAQLRIVKELLRQENRGNAHNVVAGLEKELESSENEIYSTHPILNAILVEKRQMAEEKAIAFDAFVEPGAEASLIAEIDWIVMLGNLLDNAVRAAERCPEDRKVWVRIFMQNEGRLLILKVVNPFAGKLIRKIGGFASTKTEAGRHGIGLKSVERAAEKYDGFLECLTDGNNFTAMVLLSIK